MLYEILVPGPYSDYAGVGPRKAVLLKAGDVVEFPIEYGEQLLGSGMVKIAAQAPTHLEVIVHEATEGAVSLAQSHGVDLAVVKGTGTDGRILVADVRAFITSEDD